MPDGQNATVTLSDSAVKRLRQLAAEQGNRTLRVAVGGGGCSGFQYSFTFDDRIDDDDHLGERQGVRVVIDDTSWAYLAGSEIGYRDELIGSYFSIENPNAVSTCGCGTSFAIF